MSIGSRRSLLIVAITMLISGLLWLGYLLMLPSEIVGLDIAGNESLATAEILRLSGLQTGVQYESREINQAQEVLKLHPFVRDVSIQKIRIRGKYRLQITIVERRCVALVQNNTESDIIYEVDRELMILSENKVRCRGVPLIQGTFQKNIDRFEDVMLKKMVDKWSHIQKIYPKLAARISEIRIRREGGMHFFLAGRTIRIDVPNNLDETRIRQMYGTVSWLESENIKRAIVEIRGQEVLIHGAK